MLLKEQDPFEHAYWKATSVLALDPSHSSTTVIVEVPKELPTVVKERTTATAITEGTWGFEHTKACFRDEIILFIKELKDIFNNFNQYLVEELADVQKVFFQMEQATEQHRLESRTFEVKMNLILSENERLLAQAIDKDIVKTVVNLSVNASGETVNECQKSLNGNVDDSTVKMDMDEIETLNIELEHRVTKLVTENEHLKQTYKQLYDSIKPKRVQSKEQCDALIKQVNIKSREISDLNAKLQEQGLVIAALKNELRKLKGKAVDKEAIETHSVDPNVSKDNMEPITPKLLNKRTAHSSYIKHTQEEALVLRDIVEHVKANYPQDSLLESAFRYTKVIQDLLSHISRSCPSINNFGPQLIEVTPRKKDKKVRNGTVKVNGSASVHNSKKHDNSDYVCINSDDCMSSDNLCVSNSMNDVKFCAKPKKSKSKKSKSKKDIWKPTGKVFTKIGYIWRPTGRTFTIVGIAFPLTRIATTNEVPSRKPIVLESESPKPVVNLVVQIVLWYLDFGCSKNMTGDHSQLTNFISKFLGTVKLGNDQVAKIMGCGDYQIRNVTISRVYYVEGLGHNLFSVRQICDSNLEVAFRQHTCFIRNLEGIIFIHSHLGIRWHPLPIVYCQRRLKPSLGYGIVVYLT
ncbi:hypothetical protein Tco_0625119 [Tanacetum coccineum]|uniref:Retrovirus-related Pol polyprotein from transposon TNT 1-94-like beta-barrel domain-containing protein n=1 Tax=Tanacetum coccineum TaxID=301880 RepID=A0ABQ4WFX1_9ASTR